MRVSLDKESPEITSNEMYNESDCGMRKRDRQDKDKDSTGMNDVGKILRRTFESGKMRIFRSKAMEWRTVEDEKAVLGILPACRKKRGRYFRRQT